MSVRTERVAGLIKEELSATLIRDIDTSGFGIVTVTEVIMTPDLRLAKVYVSAYGRQRTKEEILGFFAEHERHLRMVVGRNVRLKFTPELRFYLDETLERADRLEQLFKQIHEGVKEQ